MPPLSSRVLISLFASAQCAPISRWPCGQRTVSERSATESARETFNGEFPKLRKWLEGGEFSSDA